MQGRACRQNIFWPYNTSTFSAVHLDETPFTLPVRKREQKGLWVSKFAFLYAIFKRRHGSEGVKAYTLQHKSVS